MECSERQVTPCKLCSKNVIIVNYLPSQPACEVYDEQKEHRPALVEKATGRTVRYGVNAPTRQQLCSFLKKKNTHLEEQSSYEARNPQSTKKWKSKRELEAEPDASDENKGSTKSLAPMEKHLKLVPETSENKQKSLRWNRTSSWRKGQGEERCSRGRGNRACTSGLPCKQSKEDLTGTFKPEFLWVSSGESQ